MLPGSIGILENTRFHPGEEKNDPELAKGMAALGDYYVNDAFSASHRAHASTEGVAHLLPGFAGRAMEAELNALEKALGNPERPVAAVVGGAKVSTKLAVLGNLVGKVEHLIIGGGMANTFLAARGVAVGKSLYEKDLVGEAESIFERAEAAGCTIHLPYDVVVAKEFAPNPPSLRTCNVHEVAARRDDPRSRPGRGRGAGRRAQDLPHAGVERPARRVRDAAVRRGDGGPGQDRRGADPGRQPGLGRRRRRHGRGAQPGRRDAAISPSFRPRAERFSNGWRAGPCRASPPSSKQSGLERCQTRKMYDKIANGRGFIAALDQSGGSDAQSAQRLRLQGDEWSSDEEMFDLIHQMRSRIITSPCFGGGKVIGAILFERTMDGTVDGKPTPQALIDQGVVPFIKIDKGLDEEANGVQLMKPMPDLDALADRAKATGRVRHQGALGHQPRQSQAGSPRSSRSSSRSRAGARAWHGADHRAGSEHQEPGAGRGRPHPARRDSSSSSTPSQTGEQVMLKLTIPVEAEPVRSRWSTIPRSCGWSRCRGGSAARRPAASWPGTREWSRASAGRLLSDLRHDQSDEEFDRTLGSAIDEIHGASLAEA